MGAATPQPRTAGQPAKSDRNFSAPSARANSSTMSASITRIAVRNQLAAMGCGRFDIGVLLPNARMLLREGWSADRIEIALNWLRRENARRAHIFVRPHGIPGLSLIDDLNADAIARMKATGFQPALIVETSPANFQVWLNHGRVLDRLLGTHVARELARRFGGDRSSADWRHFGRLGGFTNQKQARRLENGLPPFVRLRECSGRAYDQAPDFLKQVAMHAAVTRAEREARRRSWSCVHDGSIRRLPDFHQDPRYGGDLHRADMAWALHAASRGLSEAEIQREIFHVRDLSKKGGPGRQLEYAERTAIKAVAAVRPMQR